MEMIINSPKYGKFVVLYDDEDYEKISKYKWYINKEHNFFYAKANIRKDGKQFKIKLHRLIMNFPNGMQVDHINHDTLDNRKCNLRICTNQENQMNRKPKKNTSSKFKCVYYFKRDKKWRSNIKVNNKSIYVGSFENEIDAAIAYNEAAKKYFGEFAYLNEI